MKKNAVTFALVFMLCGSAWLLKAQTDDEAPQIRADNQIIREDFLRASGNVEIIWQDYIIYADVVEFNQKSKELFAEGRVTMTSKDSVLSGEKLKFNLKTRSGELIDTYGLMSPFVRYQTDKITQVDAETLTFQRLDFSSCSQIVPRWKITGRMGKIKKEKYIELQDVVFRIKNIPVFFLPFLRYPVKKDGRSTGFLIPAVGNSSLRGLFVQSSFFWEIKSNIDLTLNLDYYQNLGLGLSEELRYLFRHANGNIRFFSLFPGIGVKADVDNLIRAEDIERLKLNGNNFVLDMSHQQDIPFLNSQLSIQSRLPGAPEVLRYLDTGFERFNLMTFRSALSWTSHFSVFTLNMAASRSQTYNINTDESEKDDRFPALSLSMKPQRLGPFPGRFSFYLSYERSMRSGEVQTVQPDFIYGQPSQKIRMDPGYTLDLINASWLKSSLAVSARNSFYARSLDPQTGEIIDEPVTLQYQTMQVNLKGPSFTRSYAASANKYLHVIEPNFNFFYATKAKNSDRIIRVSDGDFGFSSRATFSLVSRLLMKKKDGGEAPRELLLLKIEQSFYLDPETANRGMKINEQYPAFSDLSGTVNFNPGEYFSLTAQLSYNYYQTDLFRRLYNVNFHMNYAKPDAPLTGGFYYRKYCSPYGPTDHPSVQSLLGGDLSLKIPRFPFFMTVDVEYDFIRKQFTGCYLKATFDFQCITINANFSLYLLNGKLQSDYKIFPTLGNFGTGNPFF
ncbi:MAG: LPS-assembly protein LptD [Candidatus Aminicenantes bacterium]|nr:LPS-assembly protein LptD [Candidatus Aminicenantes bacterium]